VKASSDVVASLENPPMKLYKSGNKGEDDDETNYVENDGRCREDGDDKANDINDNDNNDQEGQKKSIITRKNDIKQGEKDYKNGRDNLN